MQKIANLVPSICDKTAPWSKLPVKQTPLLSRNLLLQMYQHLPEIFLQKLIKGDVSVHSWQNWEISDGKPVTRMKLQHPVTFLKSNTSSTSGMIGRAYITVWNTWIFGRKAACLLTAWPLALTGWEYRELSPEMAFLPANITGACHKAET